MNKIKMYIKGWFPCHWDEKRICRFKHWCMDCPYMPPDKEKENGRNEPIRFEGYDCPMCKQPTYSHTRCVFCGQKFINEVQTND